MDAERFPASFRPPRTLKALNVVAVAASLAAISGAVAVALVGGDSSGPFMSMARLVQVARFRGQAATLIACSTFAFGLIWAHASRSLYRYQFGPWRIPERWLASLLLAMANAATVCGVGYALERGSFPAFVTGALVGTTVGVIFWLPALAAAILAFGVPNALSRRLARQGLSGEERGELLVGITAAMISIVAFALLVGAGSGSSTLSGWALVGEAIIAFFALVATATGTTAALFARGRERVRQTFVRQVEAGAVAGYRVDATDGGKVLVHVTSLGDAYRVARLDEPLLTLDEEGRAQHRIVRR